MERSKVKTSSRTKVQKKIGLLSKREVEKRWKKARGLLRGRILKNPVAWQRQVRKDRSIAE